VIKSRLLVLMAEAGGMTRAQLAEKTGERPDTIGALARGDIKRIPVETLDKVCKVLHCDVGDILRYVSDDQE
jgi:putative transcriptional regulator